MSGCLTEVCSFVRAVSEELDAGEVLCDRGDVESGVRSYRRGLRLLRYLLLSAGGNATRGSPSMREISARALSVYPDAVSSVGIRSAAMS